MLSNTVKSGVAYRYAKEQEVTLGTLAVSHVRQNGTFYIGTAIGTFVILKSSTTVAVIAGIIGSALLGGLAAEAIVARLNESGITAKFKKAFKAEEAK